MNSTALRPPRPVLREDLTAALLGFESTTSNGYQPQSAYLILRNIIAQAR